MKHLLETLRVFPWTIRTLHEAHEYAAHRRDFADGFNAGYAAGQRHQENP